VRQVFRRHEEWLESIAERALAIERRTQMRMLLDYPKRYVEGIPGLHPSFERNFLWRAQRWRIGKSPFYLNPVGWGLARDALQEEFVLRADWEDPVNALKR